jgi:hypothetical protein
MARFVALLSTASLIAILIGIIVYLRLFAPGAPYAAFDSRGVIKEVRQLNELVTVRYSIEKVIGMREEKSPVGTESILLLVQGKVLAGVDLAKLNPSDIVVRSRGRALIRLPQPHIAEAFLDEKYTRVWDRSITWWTPWVSPDVDLEHKARMQAIEDIKAAALEMGIIPEARRNAELSIRVLLRTLGIEETVFDYSS